MPTVDGFLTSIQDAISHMEGMMRTGWPHGADEARVVAQLMKADELLWQLVTEGQGR